MCCGTDGCCKKAFVWSLIRHIKNKCGGHRLVRAMMPQKCRLRRCAVIGMAVVIRLLLGTSDVESGAIYKKHS